MAAQCACPPPPADARRPGPPSGRSRAPCRRARRARRPIVATFLCSIALATVWTDASPFLQGASGPLLFFVISALVAKVIDSLKAARAEAEASRAAQKQVLAVVAHDLRNPLSALKMTSAALRQSSPEGAVLARGRDD